MPRKKLPHYEVLRIDEVQRGLPSGIVLKQICLDQLRDVEAPDGTWTKHLDTIILPKRKRGVKFRVTYTQIFQKEL